MKPKQLQRILEKNNLFDKIFYLRQYHDARLADATPIDHYINTGIKENRKPNASFDPKWYLQNYADVKEDGANPVIHFLLHGNREGRLQNAQEKEQYDAIIEEGNFDRDFYKSNYQDLQILEESFDLLTHYIRHGQYEGRVYCKETSNRDLELQLSNEDEGTEHNRLPTYNQIKDVIQKEFDDNFYLRNYDDIRVNNIDPLEHFLTYGWKEGRNPCNWFSSTCYLDDNKDVKTLNINPFFHYLTIGRIEKRKTRGVRDKISNKKFKLFKTPDLSVVPTIDIREFTRSYKGLEDLSPDEYFDKSSIDIHWVIPDFTPGAGGHMTIFRMVRWLELFGHSCSIWIWNPTVHKTGDEAYQTIIKHFKTIKACVNIISQDNYPNKGDAIIATAWQTVNLVEKVSGFKEKFYFIQDYEPSFYGRGSKSLLAEQTYEKGFAAICASPWLKSIAENHYKAWARSFMLAYDHSVYNLNDREEKKRNKTKIAVYSRIGTERRAVELALAGLELLSRERDDFEVHLFGSDHQDLHSAPFECVVHGILRPDELADLYKDSDFGICFSATNYSLVPQEMMACGLPLVELDVESTRAIFPDNVVSLAKPNPKAITQAVSVLIDNPQKRKEQANFAFEWVSNFSWEKSARDVEAALIEKLSLGWKASKASEEDKIKATVVIPLFNGGDIFVNEVLPILKKQKAPWRYEILIIDSGSSDSALGIVKEDNSIKLVEINNKDFQHGRTRNYGVEISSGEYVAFLTQDAIPSDQYWLYNMVTVLEHYPNAAGAFGRHKAHDNATFFTKYELEEHFKQFDDLPLNVSKKMDIERFENDVTWRQKLHYYSDNSSCLRKSIWQKNPYREIKYGEDQVWASDIINKGYEKIYAISSVVKHSHDYTPEQAYERSKIDADFFNYFWGYTMLEEDKLEATIEGVTDYFKQLGEKFKLSNEEVIDRIELVKAQFKGYVDANRKTVSLFDESNQEKSKF